MIAAEEIVLPKWLKLRAPNNMNNLMMERNAAEGGGGATFSTSSTTTTNHYPPPSSIVDPQFAIMLKEAEKDGDWPGSGYEDHDAIVESIGLAELSEDDLKVVLNVMADNELIQSRKVAIESRGEYDYSSNNPLKLSECMYNMGEGSNFSLFFEDFKSSKMYKNRIFDFLQYLEYKKSVEEIKSLIKNKVKMVENAVQYIMLKHNQKNLETGKNKYAPTVLRSMLSMLLPLFQYCFNIDLKEEASILDKKISQWEKKYYVTKAKVFSKFNLKAAFELKGNDTAEMLKLHWWKPYIAIGIGFAGRSIEIYNVRREDVVFWVNENNPNDWGYKVYYNREKTELLQVTNKEDRKFCLITGDLEKEALRIYISSFLPEDTDATGNWK